MRPPVLRDFPDYFETERLLLRAPRHGDGEKLAEATRESYSELKRWMPWAVPDQTVEDAEVYVRRMAAKFMTREDLVLFMFRKADGVFLGGSGLHRIDWEVPCFEIGYWLRTTAHGKGYMTEAVLGITRFAFETLEAERVEIRCDALNEKSAAVIRRAGYLQEGHLRNNDRDTSGNLYDTLIFATIRADYFKDQTISANKRD